MDRVGAIKLVDQVASPCKLPGYSLSVTIVGSWDLLHYPTTEHERIINVQYNQYHVCFSFVMT